MPPRRRRQTRRWTRGRVAAQVAALPRGTLVWAQAVVPTADGRRQVQTDMGWLTDIHLQPRRAQTRMIAGSTFASWGAPAAPHGAARFKAAASPAPG